MPKQNPKIFASHNDYTQLLKQAGNQNAGRYRGICAAMTGLWLKNMLDRKRDLLSEPDRVRAEMLQVQYRWDPAGGGQDDVNLLNKIGMQAQKAFNQVSIGIATTLMAAKAGNYYLGDNYHAIGAITGAGTYYFYDCDARGAGGLFLFDNPEKWKALINASGYTQARGGMKTSWSGWTVWL
jgi:hypothetical protein